jgi:hypothetical protein
VGGRRPDARSFDGRPTWARVEASRREFLACCASLALASTGCATLGPRIRSGYVFANDPPPHAYAPVFHGLMTAFLPFEQPEFPVEATDVEARMLDLFRFEEDARYVHLQRMLLFFDDLALFAFPLALVEAERVARDLPGEGPAADAALAAARNTDRRLAEDFVASVAPADRFTALGLDARRTYLGLWSRSGFLVKRRFYSAAKAITMISAYSLDRLWPSIGYDGPFAGPDASR